MSDTIRHVSDTVQHVFVMYLMIMNDIRHMCKHIYYVFKRQEKPYIGIVSDKIILCKRK